MRLAFLVVAVLFVSPPAIAIAEEQGGWITFGDGATAGVYEVLAEDGTVVGVVEVVGLTPMRVGVAVGHYQIRRRFGNATEGLLEIDVGADEERPVRDRAMKRTPLPEEVRPPTPPVLDLPPPPAALRPPEVAPPPPVRRPLFLIPNKIVSAADADRGRSMRGSGLALVVGAVATLLPIALFVTGSVLIRDQRATEIWFYPLIGQMLAFSTGMGTAGALLMHRGNSEMDRDPLPRGTTKVSTLLERAKSRGAQRRKIGNALLWPGVAILTVGVLVTVLEMANVIRLNYRDVEGAISADLFLINLGVALTIAGGLNVTSGTRAIRDAEHRLLDFDPYGFPPLDPLPSLPPPSASVAPYLLKDGAGVALFGRF